MLKNFYPKMWDDTWYPQFHALWLFKGNLKKFSSIWFNKYLLCTYVVFGAAGESFRADLTCLKILTLVKEMGNHWIDKGFPEVTSILELSLECRVKSHHSEMGKGNNFKSRVCRVSGIEGFIHTCFLNKELVLSLENRVGAEIV